MSLRLDWLWECDTWESLPPTASSWADPERDLSLPLRLASDCAPADIVVTVADDPVVPDMPLHCCSRPSGGAVVDDFFFAGPPKPKNLKFIRDIEEKVFAFVNCRYS